MVKIILSEKAKEHLKKCNAGYMDCKEGNIIFIVCCGCGKCVQSIEEKVKIYG